MTEPRDIPHGIPIRLLLFDVDGVLTDGVVMMHADGSESKGFHIRDGAAIVWAQRAGIPVGLLSARKLGGDGASCGAARHQDRGAGRHQQAGLLRADRGGGGIG